MYPVKVRTRDKEVAGSSPARSTLTFSRGPIAQLGARLNGIEKVAGSSPAGSTFWPFFVQKMYQREQKDRHLTVFCFCEMQGFVYSFANTFRNVTAVPINERTTACPFS